MIIIVICFKFYTNTKIESICESELNFNRLSNDAAADDDTMC